MKIDSKFAKQNVLECIKVKMDRNYKPVTMKTLKFNQNLIVILANKHVDIQKNHNSFKTIKSTFNNFSPFNGAQLKDVDDYSIEEDIYVEEAMLFIYNEYGQLIRNFNSFQLGESNDERELLNFKVYDFSVDEENDHIYLSTKKYGKNLYFYIK